MVRSSGLLRTAAVVAGVYTLGNLEAFVAPRSASSRALRSRISLSATQADVDAAKKQAQLLSWAADKLTSEGSPMAAATAGKAQEAEAAYAAIKAEFDGQPAPAAPVPVAAAPVAAPAAAPVAAAPAGGASKEEIEAAKKQAQLLSWAAEKLAAEGSPLAAAAAGRAQQAEAAYAALKDGEAAPAAAPVAAAPVAAAPVAAPAAAPVAPAVPPADLAEAKKNAQLHSWAAEKLAAEGSPMAASMQAKAAQSVAAYEAMKEQMAVAR